MGHTGDHAEAAVLVELGLRACRAYGRDDLVAGLERVGRRLDEPDVQVVVVGEFKKGKSSLVNGLLRAPVSPVDDDVATGVPVYVRYAEQPRAAWLVRDASPDPDGGMAAMRREGLALSALRSAILERVDEVDSSAAARGIEVCLPAPLLAGGLVLVDTPGVGGLGSAHAAASLGAVSEAHAVLFVTDASQELTRSELDFLRQAQELCGRVICVLTKTDLHPAWRRIRDLTEQHLAAAGIRAPVFPVSSVVRDLARDAEGGDLDVESGYPALVAELAGTVGGDAARALVEEVRSEVGAVCDQLEAQFAGERSALADPARAQAVVDDLTVVRGRVQDLKSAAAKWNRTLTDGIADLNADVDHDLRRRIRDVLADATEAAEKHDPADTWPKMESWLQARAAHEMLANFALLRRRALELSEVVGDHFREASGAVFTGLDVIDPRATVAAQDVDHKIELERMNLRRQAGTVLKAAYGGAIMFVMLGTFVGITLGPIAIGIALVMGRRGLRDEKKRQLEARQRQAVAAIRQYLDQLSFEVGKDLRDALRGVQRQLRNHYTERAESLEASNAEALKRATEAVNQDETQRKRRLADVDTELGRIRALRQKAVGR